ncbi:MAG: hypothetical protein ACR2IT_09095 [Pirellulales bacterium]
MRTTRTTKITAWASLVGYAVVTSGLPLPVGSLSPGVSGGGRVDPVAAAKLGGKDRSTPFPCMDKPCGCGTAEQCFSNCCCHTPAETLAWARTHDIAPAVLASLERRAAAAKAPRTAEPASCCATQTAPLPTCCAAAARSEPAAADLPEVCSDYRSLAAEPATKAIAAQADPSPASDPPEGSPRRTIVLRAMLACGGLVTGFCGAAVGLPATPALRLEPTVDLIDRLAVADEFGISAGTAPDAPPPRS